MPARARCRPPSSPSLVGAACAVGEGGIVWWRVGAALVVSLALQVGVNYANDYSDGVRGTDTARVGPVRLVASGIASPQAVKRAAFVVFGVAALVGLALAVTTTWWLLAVGVACIAAAWGYTGGPSPYGYMGLGEVFVFVFFGLVATVGTTYVAVERVTALAVVAGCGVGCLACALLVVNNLRDIPTDTAAGKRTLAVRFGRSPDADALRRAGRRRLRIRRRRRDLATAGAPGAARDPRRRRARADRWSTAPAARH